MINYATIKSNALQKINDVHIYIYMYMYIFREERQNKI